MGYELIWEPRGVIKRFNGKVTGSDLVQSVIETEADPRFDSFRYVINDFLAITNCSAQIPHADHVATIDIGASITNPRIVIAVVTTSTEIEALTNHYVATSDGAYPTKIFSTMDEARAWINQHVGSPL